MPSTITLNVRNIDRTCQVVDEVKCSERLAADMQTRGFTGRQLIVEWTNKRGRKHTTLAWETKRGDWTPAFSV